MEKTTTTNVMHMHVCNKSLTHTLTFRHILTQYYIAACHRNRPEV